MRMQCYSTHGELQQQWPDCRYRTKLQTQYLTNNEFLLNSRLSPDKIFRFDEDRTQRQAERNYETSHLVQIVSNSMVQTRIPTTSSVQFVSRLNRFSSLLESLQYLQKYGEFSKQYVAVVIPTLSDRGGAQVDQQHANVEENEHGSVYRVIMANKRTFYKLLLDGTYAIRYHIRRIFQVNQQYKISRLFCKIITGQLFNDQFLRQHLRRVSLLEGQQGKQWHVIDPAMEEKYKEAFVDSARKLKCLSLQALYNQFMQQCRVLECQTYGFGLTDGFTSMPLTNLYKCKVTSVFNQIIYQIMNNVLQQLFILFQFINDQKTLDYLLVIKQNNQDINLLNIQISQQQNYLKQNHQIYQNELASQKYLQQKHEEMLQQKENMIQQLHSSKQTNQQIIQQRNSELLYLEDQFAQNQRLMAQLSPRIADLRVEVKKYSQKRDQQQKQLNEAREQLVGLVQSVNSGRASLGKNIKNYQVLLQQFQQDQQKYQKMQQSQQRQMQKDDQTFYNRQIQEANNGVQRLQQQISQARQRQDLETSLRQLNIYERLRLVEKRLPKSETPRPAPGRSIKENLKNEIQYIYNTHMDEYTQLARLVEALRPELTRYLTELEFQKQQINRRCEELLSQAERLKLENYELRNTGQDERSQVPPNVLNMTQTVVKESRWKLSSVWEPVRPQQNQPAAVRSEITFPRPKAPTPTAAPVAEQPDCKAEGSPQQHGVSQQAQATVAAGQLDDILEQPRCPDVQLGDHLQHIANDYDTTAYFSLEEKLLNYYAELLDDQCLVPVADNFLLEGSEIWNWPDEIPYYIMDPPADDTSQDNSSTADTERGQETFQQTAKQDDCSQPCIINVDAAAKQKGYKKQRGQRKFEEINIVIGDGVE